MILITGGAGFIGSNIAATLSERGRAVVVCDFLGTGDKWKNLRSTELRELVHPDDLPSWLDGHGDDVETVIHMGAISSTTEPDADLVFGTNVRFSWFLWNWCAQFGKRFLYASSAATYGSGTTGFDDDDSVSALAKLSPLNVYGWSKHVFDRRVARAIAEGEKRPKQFAGLKFFNVYGPNEYHKGSMRSVVKQSFEAVAESGEVKLFKSHRSEYRDGEQRRDFIFVEDCVAVVEWLLANPSVNGIFNVGTGTASTFLESTEALFAALGKTPRISFVDMPIALIDRYQYFTQANVGKLRAAGFTRPFTSIQDGVRKYVQRYLTQRDAYR